jgi:hypothetical protein
MNAMLGLKFGHSERFCCVSSFTSSFVNQAAEMRRSGLQSALVDTQEVFLHREVALFLAQICNKGELVGYNTLCLLNFALGSFNFRLNQGSSLSLLL